MSCGGFSYIYWPHWGNILFSITCLIITITCMTKFNFWKYGNFSSYIFLLMCIPYLSIINNYSIFGQSIDTSIIVLFGNTTLWMLYFILHIYQVRESTILNAFLYIGLFIVAIQLIQQFTYPIALFGVHTETQMNQMGLSEAVEMRNGIYRFRITNNSSILLIFALISLIKIKFEIKKIIILALLLVSVYLTLTRQIIFSTYILVVLYFLTNNKRSRKFITGVIGLLIVIFVYFNFESLFDRLLTTTKEEANVENIRVSSALFFFKESFKSISTFLFGYGIPGSGSEFQKYVEMLGFQFGYFNGDVGCIGMLWQYGIFYVLVCYSLFYRLIFKFKHIIPSYLRLYFIYAIILSLTIFPIGISKLSSIIIALTLYICDLHIAKSPLRINFNQN